MNEIDVIIKKYLNNAEVIEQNIQESFLQIIETFISFYGEEYRSKIEDAFSRTKIFVTPQDICDSVNKINKEVYDYLCAKYEEYRNCFELNGNFIDFNLYELYSLPEDVRNELEQIEERLKTCEKLYNSYNALMNKLYTKQKEISYENASIEIKEILKNKLNYPDIVLNGIQFEDYSYFAIASLEELQEYTMANDIGVNYMSSLNKINSFLRTLGILMPEIKAISYPIEYTEEDYKQDKETLEEFLNMDYCGRKIKDYIPNRKICDDITDKWESIYDKCCNEVGNEYIVELYGDKFLLPNYPGYDPYDTLFCMGLCCGQAIPFLIKGKDETRVRNVVSLNSSDLTIEKAAQTLIHELNHALENNAKSTERGTYIITSGWDIISEIDSKTLDSTPKPRENGYRDFELLNEVINDFITLELLEIIKRSSSSKFFDVIETFSLYQNAYFILKDFYNMYKDKIIQSRQENNLEIMYETVGKDNFIALANLLREFSSYIYGEAFHYDKAIQEREAGIESENTKILGIAEAKRDEIMTSMIEYSKNSHKSRGLIDIKILIIIVISIILIFIFKLF